MSPSKREAALERFAGTIRFKTVSGPGVFPLGPFHEMREYSIAAWPSIFEAAELHIAGEASVLLVWKGSEPSSKPFMLTAHQDVVPAGEGWSMDPFGGAITDGRIHGRGTIDYKCGYAGMLEACCGLLSEGFIPGRTVILAFGHDEEVGGLSGAGAITDLLAAMNVRCTSVLDEGGYIYTAPDRGDEAVVATAEKGYATFRITAEAVQGHASVPTERTAIGLISRAVIRLEELGMTDPMGTTIAPTVLTAGEKENVLPGTAEVLVNTRPAPGTTIAETRALVERTVGRRGLSVELLDNPSVSEPSRVSSWDSPDMESLRGSIAKVLGGGFSVSPGIFPAATDSRRYGRIADDTYRFMPARLGPRGIGALHSVDESISCNDYINCVEFYAEYIRRASGNR